MKRTNFTREEILHNRTVWINFLLSDPEKTTDRLEDESLGARCCLGHGSYILGIPRKEITSKRGKSIGYYFNRRKDYDRQPDILIGSFPSKTFTNMVGLHNNRGRIFTKTGTTYKVAYLDYTFSSLVEFNDATCATHKVIGEYLLSVIKGGYETPFIALRNYPKAL